MNIRPIHDRIVVKRLSGEKQTESGIVIPDQAVEKPDQGEVIAVGNGKILENGTVCEMSLNIGDVVLFGKYSGQIVKVDGGEVLVMKEDDVMGIINRG
jgi:chaperonin GroES